MLAKYYFKIKYIKGIDNARADILIRPTDYSLALIVLRSSTEHRAQRNVYPRSSLTYFLIQLNHHNHAYRIRNY